jgi:asparagine synthase (glutamine-hydrolysing)
MSGIVIFRSQDEPISQTNFKRSLDALSHQGLHRQNIWISENEKVGLGHTKLSIIDDLSGDQPLSDGERTRYIVANGEFYDLGSVKQQLKQQGYSFQTDSSSEIVLHLYDRLGTQCLDKLRGEFAFAIWDERNQLLFAARDRFGVKPLYYTVYNRTVYLASEVKALFAAGVPAHWDQESFFLTDSGVLPPNNTLFANIYQVPGGCFLIASDSGIQIHRYWDFNYPLIGDSSTQLTQEDYIEKLRHTLDEAIKIRLRSDISIGCYLSGGIDSSTVLGMASTHTSKPIQAFTISFDHATYNEEAIARETAQQIGADFHVVSLSNVELAEHFADAVCQGEMLTYNAHTPAKYLLSLATQNAGCNLVLIGEGSDETFGGYAHFCQDMLRQITAGQDEKTTRKLLEELKQNSKQISPALFVEGGAEALESVRQSLGFIPAWMERRVRLKIDGIYSDEFMAQFSQRDAYRIFLNHIDVIGQLKGRESVNQSMYLWCKTHLPVYVLRVMGESVIRYHGIEGRLPFLDRKVVELATQIPGELKIHKFTGKYILREAARPFLTDTVYAGKKHSLLAPPSTFDPQGAFFQLVQDTLRGSVMAAVPFYNQTKAIQLLDRIPEMDDIEKTALEVPLMKMLSACFLQERFGLA